MPSSDIEEQSLYDLVIDVLAEIAGDSKVPAETRLQAVEQLREAATGGRF